eukprot:11869495-Heterocapsa_arctica.AAC.1
MRLRPPPALSVRTAGLRAGDEGALREGLRRVPGLLALQRPQDSRHAQRHRTERPRLPRPAAGRGRAGPRGRDGGRSDHRRDA